MIFCKSAGIAATSIGTLFKIISCKRSSADKSGNVVICFKSLRQRCSNPVRVAIKEMSSSLAIRHSSSDLRLSVRGQDN